MDLIEARNIVGEQAEAVKRDPFTAIDPRIPTAALIVLDDLMLREERRERQAKQNTAALKRVLSRLEGAERKR